ncbi:MAG: substrate-binding domain-containing protein [Opitutaceae bacterium]|jgi:DNA-binding LacI/PurR family transcriptional regulator|nr:substrate-binding domain-containing protein [Opitutaceae bacterium]
MALPKLHLVRNGPQPIYQQISAHLKARIAAGEFPPGTKLPGIKVLAKSIGVNHLTLRQAIRKLEEERIVVTESACGTFVTDGKPTQLKVALVLPNLNESSSLISAAIQEHFSQSKSTVDILHFDENPERENEHLHRVVTEGYDGAVVFPSLNPVSIKSLLQTVIDGFPLVFIDRVPGQFPCWSVSADNHHGGRLATTHLIERGCKRIACEISGLSGVSDRYDGFMRAMGDHHLAVDYALARKFASNDDQVEQVVAQWMALPQPPDGIVFGNDWQALRGIRAIVASGRRVPADVRVMGFDNLSICEICMPPLSSIQQDYGAIGSRSAQLLEELVALPREKRFGNRHISVPVRLVAREST